MLHVKQAVERLRRAPAPVAGLLLGLAVTTFLTLVDRTVEDAVDWADVAMRLLLMSAVYTFVIWLVRRRSAVPGAAAAERAVRTGALPDDADPAALRTGLLRTRRDMLRGRWAIVAVVVTGVLGWVLFIDQASVGNSSWWLIPIGGSAVGVGVLLVGRWQLRRVDRLLAELDARPVS